MGLLAHFDGDADLPFIALKLYIKRMWDIEFTDEFGRWWQGLDEAEQESIAAGVELLRQLGPHLGRPYADTIRGSRHSNMKELRS
jgi:hypothetical protein